ncbi:hypothetical protein [Spirillospora sp. CA-128828]|uniref:hypothetical protein n=1 Tax=Spirillospora sp. CA-128828 TaxID=3240033 RepID=UPI003D8F6AD4
MTSGPALSGDQLRAALDALTDGVQPAPDAYQRVRREWRRRERRRRRIVATLMAVLFVCADAVGLWALNQADDRPHVIFNDPAPSQRQAPAIDTP